MTDRGFGSAEAVSGWGVTIAVVLVFEEEFSACVDYSVSPHALYNDSFFPPHVK